MTNLFPHQQANEPNTSVLEDLHVVLRRQPWSKWAVTALQIVKGLFSAAFLAVCLSAPSLPALAAQAHNHQAYTYDVLTADIPFRFIVGNRSFHPGRYDFIMVGNGLLTIRDAQKHYIASVITRSIESGNPASETKLVFADRKKEKQLSEIRIQNRSQVLQVLGEELAIRSSPPQMVPFDPWFSSIGPTGFRLR